MCSKRVLAAGRGAIVFITSLHHPFYGPGGGVNKLLPRFRIRNISVGGKLAAARRASEFVELNLNNRREGEARCTFTTMKTNFCPVPRQRRVPPIPRRNARCSIKKWSYSKSCDHFREVRKFCRAGCMRGSRLRKHSGNGSASHQTARFIHTGFRFCGLGNNAGNLR